MSKVQELVVEGAPARNLRASLSQLWAYRDTIRAFAERDVRVRYKQAALGVAWAAMQPLAFMAVFSLTLGRLAHVQGGGVSYAAFALSALVPWLFLSSGVSLGSNGIIANAALVRRVYFPREVPVVAPVVAGSVDFAIGLVLFFVIGPLLGAHISAWWLLAPLLWVPLAFLAVAVSMPFAAINVYYRDVGFALPFAIQLWLFASPVAYPLSAVGDRWQPYYAAINPAAGILDAFSNVLARGEAPDTVLLGISVVSAIVVGIIGYHLFKRLEPSFADVI